MVVHTNTLSGRDMEKYRKILQEQNVISYEEYLLEKPAKRTAAGNIREYMLAAVKHMLVKFM